MATFQVYLVFAFWQWLRGDSWVPDLLAAVILVVYLAGIALIYVPVFIASRRVGKEELFFGSTPPADAGRTATRWGAIAHPFRPRFFWFGLVFLLVFFVRACFISFAQGYGGPATVDRTRCNGSALLPSRSASAARVATRRATLS